MKCLSVGLNRPLYAGLTAQQASAATEPVVPSVFESRNPSRGWLPTVLYLHWLRRYGDDSSVVILRMESAGIFLSHITALQRTQRERERQRQRQRQRERNCIIYDEEIGDHCNITWHWRLSKQIGTTCECDERLQMLITALRRKSRRRRPNFQFKSGYGV